MNRAKRANEDGTFLEEIVKLNPKPGNSLIDSSKTIQHIVPDFIVSDSDGELTIELNQRNVPPLKISKDYVEMIKGFEAGKKSQREKDAILFIKQKFGLYKDPFLSEK